MVSVIVLGLLIGQDRQGPITALELEMEQLEWSPPNTSLPEPLVEVARFLFAHGLADPTGGELRLAKVATYSSTSGTRNETEVAGWVLKRSAGDKQLIVDMNGLLYEALEVGGQVTVAELEKDQTQRTLLYGMGSWGGGNDPRNGLVAVALLLRAGLVEDAERIYKDHFEGKTRGDSSTIIEQYAIHRFHRAIGAHMYGDDRLSLRDSTSLARHMEALKQTYLDDPPRSLVVSRENALSYLDAVPDLQIDAQHRVFVRRQDLDFDSLDAIDVQRRVEILIYHLNDARARQFMQPGGVSIGDSEIVRALIEIGEPAIDKLLDAYDKDTRLTRSVSYGRDFFPGRKILTVKDAAYAVLATILEHPAIGHSRGRPTAFELRAYWRVFKDVPLVERKYAELADDVATPQQWLAAAQYITDRTNIKRIGYTRVTEQLVEGEVPPMKGESLRDDRSPSVSELMALRVTQIGVTADYASSVSFFDLDNAVTLAKNLFEWNPAGSLQTLQHLTERMKNAVIDESDRPRASQYRKHSKYSRVPNLSFLIVGRLRLGDESAVQDYIDIVSILGYEPGFNRVETRFAPLILYPSERGLAALAEDLFGTTESPWHPSRLGFGLSRTDFSTRLMAVDPFRRESLKLLADETVIGTVQFDGNSYRYDAGDSGSGGIGVRQNEIDAAGIEESGEVLFKVRDSVAYAISRFQGAPLYSPVWDDERKAQAIKEIENFVHAQARALGDLIPEQSGPPRDKWLTNEPIKR